MRNPFFNAPAGSAPGSPSPPHRKPQRHRSPPTAEALRHAAAAPHYAAPHRQPAHYNSSTGSRNTPPRRSRHTVRPHFSPGRQPPSCLADHLAPITPFRPAPVSVAPANKKRGPPRKRPAHGQQFLRSSTCSQAYRSMRSGTRPARPQRDASTAAHSPSW